MDRVVVDAIAARHRILASRWLGLITAGVPDLVSKMCKRIKFTNIRVVESPVTFGEAVRDNLNYSMTVLVDYGGVKDHPLFAFPRMITEGDFFGLFLTRGQLRLILNQERLRFNTPFFFLGKKGEPYLEIRCDNTTGSYRSSSTMRITTQGLSVTYCKKPIPLELAVKWLSGDSTHIREYFSGASEEACLTTFTRECCSHCAPDAKLRTLLFLWGLFRSFGNDEAAPQLPLLSNRNDLGNVAIDDSIELLGRLIRRVLSEQGPKLDLSIKEVVHKDLHVLSQPLSVHLPDRITGALFSALATGRWTSDGSIHDVSQPACVDNAVALRAQLDRIASPLKHQNGQYIEPRTVHETSYGFICPAETPDGEDCGMVRSLALFAAMTPDVTIPDMPHCEDGHLPTLVNGELRMLKFIPDLSIVGVTQYFDERLNVHVIDSSRGRLIRPVMRGSTIAWVEPRTSTKDMPLILDSAFLGVTANALIRVRNNMGPRIAFQCSMARQAISPDPPIFLNSSHTYVLWYGQQPIYRNNLYETCDGVNLLVTIFSDPSNTEDAIVIKRQALERGVGHSYTYRLYTASKTLRKTDGPQDIFGRPGPGTRARFDANHKNIGPTGVPKVGARLNVGDTVIGKSVPVEERKGQVYYRDASVVIRKYEAGVVHAVYDTETLKKVIIRVHRPPVLGDKWTNRHGQKGVLACIRDDVDLPFSPITGVIPDVMINACCLPKRMTMGLLIEMGASKAAMLECERLAEPSTWDELTNTEHLKRIRAVLRKHGYSSSGGETLCSGRTGQILEGVVMTGFIHYSKLWHLADAKTHARGIGPRQRLFNQAVKGRRDEGGTKFGNMEIDVLGGYGAAALLRERTCSVSDEVQLGLCVACGHFAERKKLFYFCRRCRSGASIRQISFPQTTAVMLEELRASGLEVALVPQPPSPAGPS